MDGWLSCTFAVSFERHLDNGSFYEIFFVQLVCVCEHIIKIVQLNRRYSDDCYITS
jgi:hypothetical protein